MWVRTQNLESNTSTQVLLEQILIISLNSGDFICTMLFLVCHLSASMYPRDSLADLQQILVAKPILQWSFLSFIKNFRFFQRCSHAHGSKQILKNITRIHLPSALVYFYEAWHCINCGCVCLAQVDSTLNVTHCTFTNNNAELEGGVIYASVGRHVQGVTVLDNRIQQSNCTVFYCKLL